MTTSTLAVVDVESTGLDAGRHEVWEAAIITAHHDGSQLVVEDEWVAILPVDLTRADPAALRISRYYQRAGGTAGKRDDRGLANGKGATVRTIALEIATRTADRHLIGAVPSFDAAFLTRLLVKHGYQAAWHHRPLDVETYAAGERGWPVPRGLTDTADALGLDWDPDVLHTALGDARLALHIYQAVLHESCA